MACSRGSGYTEQKSDPMWKEFKEFAMRGNVVDMAVGVIIGGAFGKIITSLVNDLIMPPLGLVVGNMDFSSLALVLKAGEGTAKPVTLNYGLFLNTSLNFIIVAFSIFMMIRAVNRLKRRFEHEPAPTDKKCPYCRMMVPAEASRCGHCTSALEA